MWFGTCATQDCSWCTVNADRVTVPPWDPFSQSTVTKTQMSFPVSLHYLNVFKVTHGLLSVLLGIYIFIAEKADTWNDRSSWCPYSAKTLYNCNVRAVDQRGDPNALFLEAMSARRLKLSLVRKLHASTASPFLFKIGSKSFWFTWLELGQWKIWWNKWVVPIKWKRCLSGW